MKRIFFIAALMSLASPFICCKSKEKSSKSSDTSSSSKTVTTTYRLIVSFISKGAGTDHNLREAFTKYIESHPKKPSFELIHWGREGEADYCFTLKELSKKEQETFVKEIQTIIGKSDMAHISENAECLHKR